MITMNQMAQQLGLSRATVSMVINGRVDANARIPAETRQRVLDLAEKMNYRANGLARSVASGKSTMIGFLVFSDSYEPYWRTIVGAMDEAEARGYTIKVIPTRDDSLLAQLHRCAELRLAGLIARFDGQESRDLIMEQCRRFEIPLAFVDDVMPHSYGARVYPDEALGCQLAIDHLRELGHERIAYLAGKGADDPNGGGILRVRERCFVEAMERAGLDATRVERDTADYTDSGEIDVRSGFEAVERLLAHPDGPPTAIFAHVDQAAMTAVRAIRTRGLRVPADVSVVGYSNFGMARFFDPPLSTVVSPWHAMGRVCVAQLVERQNGDYDQTPNCQAINPTFIARQSTAPPKAEFESPQIFSV